MQFNQLSVELFARNLLNEDAVVLPGATLDSGSRLRPRTIGIQLGYRFE